MKNNYWDLQNNVQRLAETKQNIGFRKIHFRCLKMREKHVNQKLLGMMSKQYHHQRSKVRGTHLTDIKNQRIQELSQYQIT